MMHRRMKSRLFASALAAVLAPAAVLATVATPVTAEAATVKKAKCQAHVVFVSKDGDGSIPAELKFLEEQLKDDQFAAYKSFRLMEQKELKLSLGKASEVKFSSENRLRLSLLGNDDKHLKLHAELTGRDGKKMLNTDYSIEDAGVLMIVAGKVSHEVDGKQVDGKKVFAIQCARSG